MEVSFGVRNGPPKARKPTPREGVLPPLWDRFRVIIIKSIYINAPPKVIEIFGANPSGSYPPVLPPSKRGVKLARNRGQKPTMEIGLVLKRRVANFPRTPRDPPLRGGPGGSEGNLGEGL